MAAFTSAAKGDWDWTMMIRQPSSMTADVVAGLTDEVVHEKGLAAARELRLETIEEGTAAQVLYVGPYTERADHRAAAHDHPAALPAVG